MFNEANAHVEVTSGRGGEGGARQGPGAPPMRRNRPSSLDGVPGCYSVIRSRSPSTRTIRIRVDRLGLPRFAASAL